MITTPQLPKRQQPRDQPPGVSDISLASSTAHESAKCLGMPGLDPLDLAARPRPRQEADSDPMQEPASAAKTVRQQVRAVTVQEIASGHGEGDRCPSTRQVFTQEGSRPARTQGAKARAFPPQLFQRQIRTQQPVSRRRRRRWLFQRGWASRSNLPPEATMRSAGYPAPAARHHSHRTWAGLNRSRRQARSVPMEIHRQDGLLLCKQPKAVSQGVSEAAVSASVDIFQGPRLGRQSAGWDRHPPASLDPAGLQRKTAQGDLSLRRPRHEL